ncbi:hypothetical protein [Atlantibacter hermannii]|uniref:hypothetical protein n=1 Tax=Atlantibacter hermannii TaxID=565 RepID=UPI00289DDDD2|nr:hypothetical protein [Atlantibacter hermannii]
MSTTDFLKTLDYDQLVFCRDKCDDMIRAIQAEEKKVAWAVTDGTTNYDWFRTEDYLKAVDCLATTANLLWDDADQYATRLSPCLNLSIKGKRLPLSEYNALFTDVQGD